MKILKFYLRDGLARGCGRRKSLPSHWFTNTHNSQEWTRLALCSFTANLGENCPEVDPLPLGSFASLFGVCWWWLALVYLFFHRRTSRLWPLKIVSTCSICSKICWKFLTKKWRLSEGLVLLLISSCFYNALTGCDAHCCVASNFCKVFIFFSFLEIWRKKQDL